MRVMLEPLIRLDSCYPSIQLRSSVSRGWSRQPCGNAARGMSFCRSFSCQGRWTPSLDGWASSDERQAGEGITIEVSFGSEPIASLLRLSVCDLLVAGR